MPTMFSRRRGSSASRHTAAPLDQTTRASAATAAAHAFLARPPSNSNLSSAAAAAALRSVTTTPEPVGSIQTKRMVRRGSNASIGSSSIMSGRRGPSRGGLQRRDSQGSMTERTFRSPSPGARGYANGARSPAADAPPLPAIPPGMYGGQHQRSSSMEPQQRVISPTPTGRGQRASSMDRRTMPPNSVKRGGKRLSNVNEELERTTSVNFSRPRSSEPSSPVSPTTDKQHTHGPGNWFSEPIPEATSAHLPAQRTALEQKVARIQAAAGQPVKKDHSVGSAQGTHLHQVAQQLPPERPTASRTPSYETADAIMEYDPNSRTFVTKPRPKPKAPVAPAPIQTLPQVPKLAPGMYDPHTRSIVPHPEPKTLAQASTSRASSMTAISQKSPPLLDTDVAPPPRNPARISPVSSPSKGLHKQPSVVHELPDEEESQASPSTGGYISTSAGPVKAYAAPTARHQRSSSLDIPRGSYDGALRGRGTSISPSRHTHFSAKPVVQGTIHNPPSRNLSPIKSAMKHSPASSIRTSSPLTNLSSGPRSPSSETSDNTSQASQDAVSGMKKKKKSARVSFDEQPQVVKGTSTASMRASLDDSEDDELMKPRPALPSFGSVRKQRNPAIAEKVTETPPERHEASSDHAVGGILKKTQDATLPVPPQVRSKEGAETISDDSDSDLGAPVATSTSAQPQVVITTEDKADSDAPVIRDFAAVPSKPEGLDVPAINLLPPTPGAEEEHRTLSPDSSPKPRHSFEINMPGGWHRDSLHEAEVTSAGAATATASAIEAQSQGPVIPDDPVIYESPIEHSPLLSPIDESDDDSAAFSDAAEDPSEFENGGFASLDAIAVSPMTNALPAATSTNDRLGTASPPESPTAKKVEKNAQRSGFGDRRSDGDWNQATAYWSKLSRQQREAIEREHLSSDDEGRPSVPIARKKKAAVSGPATSAAYADDESPRAALKPSPQPAMRKSMRAQPEPEPAAARAVSPEVHMRKSMRSAGSVGAGSVNTDNGPTAGRSGGMASTLRNGPPASRQRQSAAQPTGALQKKSMRSNSIASQTSVAPGESAAVAPIGRKRQQQTHSAQSSDSLATKATPAVSTQLQKELAHDSDSESSFKKQRRQRTSASNMGGRYSMAKGMRGAPVASPPPARGKRAVSPEPARGKGRDSFSIRSLSPTGSLFGRKKRAEDVRQSIRGTSIDNGSRMSLRNQPAQKTMRPRSTQQVKSSASRFKSRFADSDDESDDDKTSRGIFKSRFATESDDEDDDVFIPADLRPVRGIPRKQGETDRDSTDLEDEDDNPRTSSRGREKMAEPIVPASADIDAAMEIARKKLGITNGSTEAATGKQGGALQQGSLRGTGTALQAEPKSKPEEVDIKPRKRGWSLLHRNRNSTSSVTQLTPRLQGDIPPVPPVLSTPTLAGPMTSTTDVTEPLTPTPRPQSPTLSPVGRLIRRSSAHQPPRFRRGDSTYSNATAPPAVGESSLDGDWPLPPVPGVPEKYSARPSTSDGRPQVRFDEKNDPAMNAAAEGRGGVYSARTGKKKKFGKLRKAFGLAD